MGEASGTVLPQDYTSIFPVPGRKRAVYTVNKSSGVEVDSAPEQNGLIRNIIFCQEFFEFVNF